MERLVKTISNYSGKIKDLEEQIKVLEEKIQLVNEPYRAELIEIMSSKVANGERFYQVHNGYIMVTKVKTAHVTGLSGFTPRVVVEGLFMRQPTGKCDSYLYFGTGEGFLISEMIPTTQEKFLSELEEYVKYVCEGLTYKPSPMYRESGDRLDRALKEARKAGIDIDYYPEIKVEML